MLEELAELQSEPWYWPSASKAEIAKALDGKPDGTFVVRDASSPGDFTLTVRAKGETKLVKICVASGRCGFNVASLDFRSVQSLIEAHKNVSLKTYNAHLDCMLLFPLCDPNRRQSGDVEFDNNLAIERFRTAKCAFSRSTKIYDLMHAEQIRAEALMRAQSAAHADILKKEKLFDTMRRTQLEVIEEAPAAGEEESDEASSLAESVEEKKQRAIAFQSNQRVCKTIQANLRTDADTIEEHLKRIRDFVQKHREEMQLQSERIQALSIQLESQIAIVRGTGRDGKPKPGCTQILTEAALKNLSEQIEQMRQAHESIAMSRILNELPLKWDHARFLVNDASKESAAALIEAARVRLTDEWRARETRRKTSTSSGSDAAAPPPPPHAPPPLDGVFLIRPSASQAGRLVLSVLHAGRVSHCLIEDAEQGWGFENGGLYFVSIGDFVRYYAHHSLEEHNKSIRTMLTEPVLP